MTVFMSESGSKWHLTPLCPYLRGDWGIAEFRFVWENGFRCCKHCAMLAYDGWLCQPPRVAEGQDRTFHLSLPNSIQSPVW